MNKFGVWPHLPEGKCWSICPSSEYFISISTSLFHSLTELSLATLISEVGFPDYSNEEWGFTGRLMPSLFLYWLIPSKTPPIASASKK